MNRVEVQQLLALAIRREISLLSGRKKSLLFYMCWNFSKSLK